MKRGLVFTLCAAALAMGTAATAQAQNVQLSLNLRYTNPGDPDQGGSWFLAAKTDDADGIAAVSAYLNNVAATGITYGTAATTFPAQNYTAITAANINAILNGGNPFAGTFGTAVNVVYGQDTSIAGIIGGVGTATFAQRQAVDPLRNTANWNNATIIARGTFAGGGTAANQFNRPTFTTAGTNSTDANTLAGTTAGTAAQDAAVTLVVRGDSVTTFNLEATAGAGLRFGDRNRNGTVAFLSDIQPSLGAIGTGSGKTWEDGDFNGNGTVAFLSDIQPALGQIGQPAPPAPISAVPEPTTVGLLAIGTAALAAFRRRK